MSLRESYSRLKKDIKQRLKGKKRKPDGTGVNPPSQPEPPAVGGSGRDQGGDGEDVDVQHTYSTNKSVQRPGPEPVAADESENGQEGAGQQCQIPPPPPDVEHVVESEQRGEPERVYPSPFIPLPPHSGELDNNVGINAVPDHMPKDLPSGKSTMPAAAPGEKKSNWKSTASATANLLLRGVRDSADVFGPLKSVAGGLCFILENCERTKANKQAIESLAPRVEALAGRLRDFVPEGDTKERDRRSKLERKFNDVLGELELLTEQGNAVGFFNNVENADKLAGLVEVIRDAVMDYQLQLQQDIYDKSCQLIGDVDLILLNGMHHTVGAGHRSGNRQGCLGGTRTDILLQLEDWSENETNQRVFWLNGLAGTGKSTIAQTFADITFGEGKLGASFFCSRDFEDRSSIQAIFPTLAFQLAYQYPPFREQLLRVLRANPEIGRESLCTQFERVIVGPFKATRISTLIIVDALDECKDDEPASAILSVLSRYMDEISTVKFFITGRPEPRIRSGFRLKSLRPITEVLRLHDVERSSVDSDIRLFFRVRLTDIAKTRSDCDFAQNWPSSLDMDILCKKAAGFFIYASTVVKFVASPSRIPAEQLEWVISLPQSTTREGRGIDPLYTQVLGQAVCDVGVDDEDKEEIYSRFKTVVGAVLLVFNPLSVRTLSELIRVSNISTALYSLHSLLLVPHQEKPEDPIRPFHKSFPDFITDPNRCKDKRFFVEPAVHHTEILLSCLRLMRERLKRNICHLDDYTILSEVKDLSVRKRDHIGDALEYACQYWTRHLPWIPGSSPRIQEVENAINNFFTTHLLHWIEVLVVMENLGVGVHAMNDINQWCEAAGLPHKWTYDTQRFLLEYFDTIHVSPSHIYHSALPLCPPSSWLWKNYNAEFSNEVKIVKGSPAEWRKCSRTVTFDWGAFSLSCWNEIAAVGLSSGNIVILNVITGIRLYVLSGHSGGVHSVTFSSDGELLVSGSGDKTIKLWDLQTGGLVKTFSGHRDEVKSVSISAKPTMIASGSRDKTICLWDIQTGECQRVIGQEEEVEYVILSPIKPYDLISMSGNKTRGWDIKGNQVGKDFDGFSITFSLDGTRFALCSSGLITVKNSATRATVAEFHVSHALFWQCCFSPDGRLVSAAHNNIIYVWDILCLDPHLIEIFKGHPGHVNGLTFFTPSSLISVCLDGYVKLWQIVSSSKDQAEPYTEPIPLFEERVKCITLQAKHGIVITGSKDGLVKIWDISTGLCKETFQTPAKDDSIMETRLIDGRFITVGMTSEEDCENIYIWDNEEQVLVMDNSESFWSFRILEDGSRVFCFLQNGFQVRSIQTGEIVGEVQFGLDHDNLLLLHTIDGCKIWTDQYEIQGWDFGTPGSSPVQLTNVPPSKLHPCGGMLWNTQLFRVQEVVTGKVVFQLAKGFGEPIDVQWNEQYLVACFGPTNVLVLDFDHLFPR